MFQTSNGYVIFYQVEIDKRNSSQTLFNQREERWALSTALYDGIIHW